MKKGLVIGIMFLLLCTFASVALAKNEARSLHKAIIDNDIAKVKMILANGKTDIDSRQWTKGRTPLMLAADNGNIEIVKVLLQSGAKTDIKSRGGNTALHYAVLGNHTKVAQELYRYGADPNKRNKSYQSPYSIAKFYKNQELTDFWDDK